MKERLINNSYVGPDFESLTFDEMKMIQGSGDLQAETTPACFFIGLGTGALISAKFC